MDRASSTISQFWTIFSVLSPKVPSLACVQILVLIFGSRKFHGILGEVPLVFQESLFSCTLYADLAGRHLLVLYHNVVLL